MTVGGEGEGCVRSVNVSRNDDWAGVAEVRPVEALAGAGENEPGGNEPGDKKEVLVAKLLVILTRHSLSVQPPRMAGRPKRDQLR